MNIMAIRVMFIFVRHITPSGTRTHDHRYCIYRIARTTFQRPNQLGHGATPKMVVRDLEVMNVAVEQHTVYPGSNPDGCTLYIQITNRINY